MWVLFGSFSIFSNFYLLDVHNKTHVAEQIYNETYAKTGLKIKLPWFSLGLLKVHDCWSIYLINLSPPEYEHVYLSDVCM